MKRARLIHSWLKTAAVLTAVFVFFACLLQSTQPKTLRNCKSRTLAETQIENETEEDVQESETSHSLRAVLHEPRINAEPEGQLFLTFSARRAAPLFHGWNFPLRI